MTELEVVSKTCTKCDEEKLLSEFYRNRNTRDGRASACKVCSLAQVKASQARLREEIGDAAFRSLKRESVRRYRDTAHGREQARLQSEAYRVAEANLRHAHPEEFEALLREARYELGLPV